MAKQIAVTDLTYNQLNELRKHQGQKYSFNTIIQALMRDALSMQDSNGMFSRLQWHAIQHTLKAMEDQGWMTTYRIQYSHVLRLMMSGNFKDAREYIKEQFPDGHTYTDPSSYGK